jgi:Protein of unknown function (DUF3304)
MRAKLKALLIVFLGVAAMAGCGRPAPPNPANEMVPASMRLLNYSDGEVSVRVSDPKRPESGASDGLGPHAGGGRASCCVEIPAYWRPGIRVLVRYKTDPKSDGEWRDSVVELLPYPNGIAGTLYVAFYGPDDIEVMSSMFNPSHEKWPGKRRGFPYESRGIR